MKMSVRIRGRVGKLKQMAEKEKDSGHLVTDTCQPLNILILTSSLSSLKDIKTPIDGINI